MPVVLAPAPTVLLRVMWYTIVLAVLTAMVMHELAHYGAARWFGVRVERMFLFFDANHFAMWSKQVGRTRFGIGWLPLGAYVTLAGVERMDDPAKRDEAPLPWELQARPCFEQCCILLAGIAVNVLTMVLLQWLGATDGFGYYLAMASGYLAWMNVLPFAHSDGDRTLELLVTAWKPGPRTHLLMAALFGAVAIAGGLVVMHHYPLW